MYIHSNAVCLQNDLMTELVALRNTVAREAGIPPFTVASNKLLADLTVTRYLTIMYNSGGNVDISFHSDLQVWDALKALKESLKFG